MSCQKMCTLRLIVPFLIKSTLPLDACWFWCLQHLCWSNSDRLFRCKNLRPITHQTDIMHLKLELKFQQTLMLSENCWVWISKVSRFDLCSEKKFLQEILHVSLSFKCWVGLSSLTLWCTCPQAWGHLWDFSLVLVWLKIHVFEGRFALKDYWVLWETFWPSRKMQLCLTLRPSFKVIWSKMAATNQNSSFLHRQSPANSTNKFYCAYFDIYSGEYSFLRKKWLQPI
jgi:hypothetical protein